MTLDLDPSTIEQARLHQAELDRIVRALAGGDEAFALTFVERFGFVVAAELDAAGASSDRVDPLVQEVAFALLGEPLHPTDAPWSAVRAAVARVVERHVDSSDGAHRLRGRISAS